jgi:hypothetical protein
MQFLAIELDLRARRRVTDDEFALLQVVRQPNRRLRGVRAGTGYCAKAKDWIAKNTKKDKEFS